PTPFRSPDDRRDRAHRAAGPWPLRPLHGIRAANRPGPRSRRHPGPQAARHRTRRGGRSRLCPGLALRASETTMSIADIRENYQKFELLESTVSADPYAQFGRWFEQALHSEVREPTAMTLATATADGRPSARIVLLKGFDT